MPYDCVEIFSPTICDAQMIEELYQKLEEQFPAVLSSKLVHQICEKPTKRSRFKVIKDRLKTRSKQQATFGDEKLNMYLSFSNCVSSLEKPGVPYSRISLSINRRICIDLEQLSSIIIYICEHTLAYWGVFMPGDDLVSLRWILQKDELLKRSESSYSGDQQLVLDIKNLLIEYPDLSELPTEMRIHGYLYRIKDLRIVCEIGWVNYWSPSVCELNGFPDHENTFDNDTTYTRTLLGGYLWLLTKTPWIMADKSHRQRLITAYERFPNVGMKVM
jgi:hypothetical protein